jgi:hypothetical protein
MPNAEFHEYEDNPQARAELLDFLQHTGVLHPRLGWCFDS